MNILSLFDGMSCGMLAMLKAGIQVDNYYAYEIDKYAIQTATYNFPQIQECGDVFKGDYTQYEGIDYLIGGSVCTYWSIAQSPDKRETTASGIGWELFSQYVRALHEAKPKFFIYENNKSMSKEIRKAITETFGFEDICINSARVSAQNRHRLYWVGKRNADGTYSKVDVEQPEDRGILLRDVLDGVTDREKGRAVIGSTGRTTEREYFKKFQGNMAYEPVNTTIDGKAQCLRTTCYKDGIRNIAGNIIDRKTGVAEPVCIASRGRYSDTDSRTNKTDAPTYQHYEARTDGKTTTLCAEGGGMGAKTGLYAIPIEFDGDIPVKAISAADGKTYTVYEVKDGNITIKSKTYPIKLVDGYYIIRKLTVSECKRLQTVPEWYEFPVSDTQSYKMLGNGWSVDVIVHLIEATRR